jgi:hypothetical protein
MLRSFCKGYSEGMPTKIFVVIFCLGSIVLNAQDNRLAFGVSASLDRNSYFAVKDVGPVDFKGRNNYSVGIIFRYSVTERITLSTKALYSTKNFKTELHDYYAPIQGGDPVIIDDPELDYSNSFIDLPIEFNYKLNKGNKVEIFGVAGFVNSFQVAHKNEHVDIAELDNQDAKTYQDYLLSTKFGTGFLFKSKKIGIYLEPQVRFYITKVHQGWPEERPIHFGLELQILKI